jgi:hypothetical protein
MRFLIIWAFFVSFKLNAQNWQYIKSTEGIKVYHKKVGKLKDVKIETEFNASLSTVCHALLDVPSFQKWIYKVESSKVLKSYGPRQTLIHNFIDMPWPAKNRDLVFMNKLSQNTDSKEVVSEDFCMAKSEPIDKNYVRVTDFYAKWVFKPSPSGGVLATYIIHSDPGGDLPDTVTNLFIDEGPINSIKAFKKLLTDKKYGNLNTLKILN